MTRHAAHDTRLGRLQRGRGSGFREALASPATARAEVLQCLLDDPRADPHTETRTRYHAELALHLQLPVEPILQRAEAAEPDWTAVDLLAELAARGSTDCLRLLAEPERRPQLAAGMLAYLRDYPAWSATHLPIAAVQHFAEVLHAGDELVDDVGLYDEFWRPWAAHIARVAEACEANDAAAAAARDALPPPVADPTALSTADLLDHLEDFRSSTIDSELGRRTSADDRALLAFRAENDQLAWRFFAAAKALGAMHDPRLLERAEVLFAREDVFHDPQRCLSTTERQRRQALLLYVTALPATTCLPLARAWWPRGGFFAVAAGRVLALHAEPVDRSWLEASAAAALARGPDADPSAQTAALARLGDPRSAPLLTAIAEATSRSSLRVEALRGLVAATQAPGSPRPAALGEALWDCEAEARALACRHVQQPDEAARRRFGELASDGLEDVELRNLAAGQLARSVVPSPAPRHNEP